MKIDKDWLQGLPREIQKYYENFTLADGQTKRDLFLLPIPSEELKGNDEEILKFTNILNSTVKDVIWNQPEKLRDFGHEDLDIEGIKLRNNKYLFNYARIDTIFDGTGFQIIEFNSRRPQMFEDADWFNKAFPNLINDNNTNSIINSFLEDYRYLHGKYPVNVILINNQMKKDYPYSMYNLLKPKCQLIPIKLGDIREFEKNLQLKDNHLFFNSKHIDAIILQYQYVGKNSFYYNGGIRNTKIKEAYNRGNLEIYSSPSSNTLGSKIALSMLPSNSSPMLPETYSSQYLEKVDKSKYYIKSPKSVSGNGVWDATNATPIKERSIIQKKVELGTRDIFDLQTMDYRKAAVTYEPFIINNPYDKLRVSGYSSRAILEENLSKINRFNPSDNHKEILFGGIINYGKTLHS